MNEVVLTCTHSKNKKNVTLCHQKIVIFTVVKVAVHDIGMLTFKKTLNTYFLVTTFFPFTIFVDVDVDRKFPPPPPPPPPPPGPPNDVLENEVKLKQEEKKTGLLQDFFYLVLI